MKIQAQKGNKYGLDKAACPRRKQPIKPVSVSATGWDGHTRLPECVYNQFNDVAADLDPADRGQRWHRSLGTADANPGVGAGVPGPRSPAARGTFALTGAAGKCIFTAAQ